MCVVRVEIEAEAFSGAKIVGREAKYRKIPSETWIPFSISNSGSIFTPNISEVGVYELAFRVKDSLGAWSQWKEGSIFEVNDDCVNGQIYDEWTDTGRQQHFRDTTATYADNDCGRYLFKEQMKGKETRFVYVSERAIPDTSPRWEKKGAEYSVNNIVYQNYIDMNKCSASYGQIDVRLVK